MPIVRRASPRLPTSSGWTTTRSVSCLRCPMRKRAPRRSIASRVRSPPRARLTAWRDERYAIATRFGAPPWFLLERAAARYFGVHTYAAHVNGLVARPGSRRRCGSPAAARLSRSIPACSTTWSAAALRRAIRLRETVIKESWEEAGIDAALAAPRAPDGYGRHPPRCNRTACSARRFSFTTSCCLASFHAARPGRRGGRAPPCRSRRRARLIANDSGPDVVTARREPRRRSIASCATTRFAPTPLTSASAPSAPPPQPLRRAPDAQLVLGCGARRGGAGLTCRIPSSASVSRTALTACRISSGPIAPMQPTRNVSTCVSLPG